MKRTPHSEKGVGFLCQAPQVRPVESVRVGQENVNSENIENDEINRKRGSHSIEWESLILLHITSYIMHACMQLVVPNAVKNAVSAATTIFTTISNALCFLSIII